MLTLLGAAMPLALLMRQVTVYRSNPDGSTTKIPLGQVKYHKESYDSSIDKPLSQRILQSYRELEAAGKLRPGDCIGGKSFTRRLWENEAAAGG